MRAISCANRRVARRNGLDTRGAPRRTAAASAQSFLTQ